MTQDRHLPWTDHLEEKARREFLRDLDDTLNGVYLLGTSSAKRTTDEYLAALETLLAAWRNTAEVLADPELRKTLLDYGSQDGGPVLPPDVCWEPGLCTLEYPCPRCGTRDKEQEARF